MAAAAPVVIAILAAPDRIAQVDGAGIRGGAHHSADKATSKGAHGRVARHGSDRRAASTADQGSTGQTITLICAATGQEQSNCTSGSRQYGTHEFLLLASVTTFSKCRCSWFPVGQGVGTFPLACAAWRSDCDRLVRRDLRLIPPVRPPGILRATQAQKFRI
jgi:hypothetical protein